MVNEVRLTADPIDASQLISFVQDPSSGAISTFLGTTRDHFESLFTSDLSLSP
jgi:molybdopterin synthase catalytic subunit